MITHTKFFIMSGLLAAFLLVVVINGVGLINDSVDASEVLSEEVKVKNITLSEHAEYPPPVIQLQQLVMDRLKKHPELLRATNIDNIKVMPETMSDSHRIIALRQRLNTLIITNNESTK
ncbi:hypothetical protein [Vibrio cionasavignyae]|uniref:hypothetical protein n=1 Tax=Vibrio cionasavignyae TaxID=2910252 RepID=UPI003D0CBF05